MDVSKKNYATGCIKKEQYFYNFFKKLKSCTANVVNFIYVAARYRIFSFLDFIYTFFLHYIKFSKFAKIDAILSLEYFLESPFAISKRYLQLKLDKDIYQYGETPIMTIEKIAKEVKICENDNIFELGSGTGRCAFYLTCSRNCHVTAIERISTFVDFANKLAKNNKLYNINFIQNDFLSQDFSTATVIYLYGSKMTDDQIEALILQLNTANPGTKIITVSYNLNEIVHKSKNLSISNCNFPVISSFDAEFFWGKTKVFVQKKL